MEDNSRSKSPLVLIVLAVILIGIGSYLVFSGNNASLFGGKTEPEKVEPTPEPTPEPEPEPEPIPDRSIKPADEVLENISIYLNDRKNLDLPDEAWTIENVRILAYGNGDSYLVSYDAITESEEYQSVINYNTVITIVDESISGEFPGWNANVDSRDLAGYEFVYYESEDVPIEEPTEEPTEEPVEEPVEEPIENQEVTE